MSKNNNGGLLFIILPVVFLLVLGSSILDFNKLDVLYLIVILIYTIKYIKFTKKSH